MEVIAIANDVQGAEVAIPWVERAGATYRVLLDDSNAIGTACGLKYVPVGILIDGEGRLVRPVGSVNIDGADFRGELEEWARTGVIPAAWQDAEMPGPVAEPSADEAEADARMQLARVLLGRGKRDEALAELWQAVVLDPQNWLIRKQMWAIESPDAFYDGAVDYEWQAAQQEREAESLLSGE